MAGRGLVTGGFLLCGWLITGAGHAYAAQATPPPAPHDLLTGTVVTGSDAAAAVLASVVHRPASALLAEPGFPGNAGAGAGNQAPGARGAGAPAAAAADPLASAVSGVSGVITSGAVPGQSLVSGLDGTAGGDLVTDAASSLPQLPGAAIGGVRAAAMDLMAQEGTRGAAAAPITRPAAAGARRTAGAGHRTAPHRGQPGHLAAPAALSAVAHAWRAHHRGAGAVTGQHGRPRRTVPGGRLSPGAATQTDPVASGGGAGTAQPAAQAPFGSDGWNQAGKLVRVRTSRRSGGRAGADDPAVSPD